MSLEHWASAKLCGMVQGMELQNFVNRHFRFQERKPPNGISPAGKFTASEKTRTNAFDYVSF